MFKNKKTHKIVQAIVRMLDMENKETKHKKKTRILTRIKRRMIARKVKIEQSEIPLNSKISKVLFRLGFLKQKDWDQSQRIWGDIPRRLEILRSGTQRTGY